MWSDETKFLTNFNIAPLAHLILTGISDLDLLLAHRTRLRPGTEGTRHQNGPERHVGTMPHKTVRSISAANSWFSWR